MRQEEARHCSLSFPLTTTTGFRVVAFRTPLPMSLPSDPSVFDILNLFRRHWFLSRDWLVSNVASAQWTDGLSINWVKFPPVVHTHLVRCAIKLAPSVPAAKVKRVMFVFLLEVLNGDSPTSSFFAPRRVRAPHRRRTRKPREGGDQPVGTMAVDAPSPVIPSQPNPPGPLSPGLVPGNGDPSSEEPAGDGSNVTCGWASSSPRVFLAPSVRMVVPVAPSRPGPSRPPSVLGVKRSLLPASPSPPSSPPGLPSSPPSRYDTSLSLVPQDWQDWIAVHRQIAACGPLSRVTHNDVAGFEGLLLAQVENAGPSSPSVLTPALAPAPVAVVPPRLPPSSIPSLPNHGVSPLLSTAGRLVSWRQVNLGAPSEWVEYDATGCYIWAAFNCDPPFDWPHPHWAKPQDGYDVPIV